MFFLQHLADSQLKFDSRFLHLSLPHGPRDARVLFGLQILRPKGTKCIEDGDFTKGAHYHPIGTYMDPVVKFFCLVTEY